MIETNSHPDRLPFEPETLPTARQRYPKALKPIYNVEAVRISQTNRIGSQRKHVFDFKTGLRLIISRGFASMNSPEDRGPFLHVSASWDPGHVNVAANKVPIGEVVKTFLYISRASNKIEPVFTEVSRNGVLHVLFPDPIGYSPYVPLEVMNRHEAHEPAEELTVGEFFGRDPRVFCSRCRQQDETSPANGEQNTDPDV